MTDSRTARLKAASVVWLDPSPSVSLSAQRCWHRILRLCSNQFHPLLHSPSPFRETALHAEWRIIRQPLTQTISDQISRCKCVSMSSGPQYTVLVLWILYLFVCTCWEFSPALAVLLVYLGGTEPTYSWVGYNGYQWIVFECSKTCSTLQYATTMYCFLADIMSIMFQLHN